MVAEVEKQEKELFAAQKKIGTLQDQVKRQKAECDQLKLVSYKLLLSLVKERTQR